jgi:hypothetical protein
MHSNRKYLQDNRGKRALGIRVPAETHENIVQQAAATANSRATAVKLRDEKHLSKARSLLQVHFPDMPVSSAEKVLQHAYRKGSGRIGRQTTVKDERKIKLAVEAYIRHTHTSYDRMLHAGINRQIARQLIWDFVQDIKVKWGGSISNKARSTKCGVKKKTPTKSKLTAKSRVHKVTKVNTPEVKKTREERKKDLKRKKSEGERLKKPCQTTQDRRAQHSLALGTYDVSAQDAQKVVRSYI